MTIDFPSADQCATFGYSFDNECNGITHTISQNWRIMQDSQGLTFFAPVSTVASISTTQGPQGLTGMTGMTGMTGNTGAVGVTGPQGFTFANTQTEYGLIYLPDGYVDGDESNGVTLSSSDLEIASITGGALSVGRAKELMSAYSSISMNNTNTTYINIPMSTSSNTIKRDLDPTSDLSEIDGFYLQGCDLGKYVSIILKRTAAGTGPTTFHSDFIVEINGTDLSTPSLTVNYATGISYDLGTSQDDVDVFYVSVINVDYTGTNPTGAEILVNHQRYYTT